MSNCDVITQVCQELSKGKIDESKKSLGKVIPKRNCRNVKIAYLA